MEINIEKLNQLSRLHFQKYNIELMEFSNIYDRNGFLYILKAEENISKIGRTVISPAKRLSAINGFHWKKIELIYVAKVQDCVSCERCVHRIFQDYRLKGEWFNLRPEIIYNITFKTNQGIKWIKYNSKDDCHYEEIENDIFIKKQKRIKNELYQEEVA